MHISCNHSTVSWPNPPNEISTIQPQTTGCVPSDQTLPTLPRGQAVLSGHGSQATHLCNYPILQAPLTVTDSPCRLITQFTTDIRFLKGSSNAAADALSRLEMDAIHTGDRQTINFTAMAQAQQEDPKLQDAQDSSLQLRADHLLTVDATLLCNMSMCTPRPYVSQPFCHAVSDALHSLSHPGIRAIQRLMTARCVATL